jgi:hypothetical protein
VLFCYHPTLLLFLLISEVSPCNNRSWHVSFAFSEQILDYQSPMLYNCRPTGTVIFAMRLTISIDNCSSRSLELCSCSCCRQVMTLLYFLFSFCYRYTLKPVGGSHVMPLLCHYHLSLLPET